ncbi:hypothetical protein K1T35_11890 [Pseudonocardia sp. DSM 110487]|uniref:MmyB family transcriptional regulator n=1 Tax=Pseudonocardia sp. DSM 110487 TaxID=2865833 RepID=UPI001C695F48|nr:hypothetical protein [Pseudonocardia sp. DSM 110487]QYN40180.1 hypothetical protein K1T35_11890 [Pseudonocardia sp. DSM 110487]
MNTRVRHTPEAEGPFKAALVADLRAAAGRYPADQALRRLVAELRANSARFAELRSRRSWSAIRAPARWTRAR